MDSIRVKLNIIENKINSIYKKHQNNIYDYDKTINDIGYVISYLDEIQGNINTHFYGLGILNSMIEDKLTFYKFNREFEFKLDYFTIKYIIDFNQKRIYSMFKKIKGFEGIEWPSEFSCNNDNHDISNRIKYFIKNKKIADVNEMEILYSRVFKDIENVSNFIILMLNKLENKSENDLIRIFKTNVKMLKSFDLNSIIENFNLQNDLLIDKIDLNRKIRKHINHIEDLGETKKYMLVYDAIFRICEAMHLININYEIENSENNYISEQNKFFLNDILFNTAINLVSSYDKIAKELSGESYFSQLNKAKIKTCYEVSNLREFDIDELERIKIMARELFKVKNTMLHSNTPGRLLHEDDLDIYRRYKESLINKHIKIVEMILEFIIKRKENAS